MRTVALIALVISCGCGGPKLGGPDGPLDTFVAFPSDFSGYMHWESHTLSSTEVQGEVHSTGARTLYLSRRPPRGATGFPVGTLIVKAVPGAGRVFARVKRGGDYNADHRVDGGLVVGARGWEWFELQHVTAEDVTFIWRGLGPPVGEGYGSDPNGCNACHTLAQANDFVSAPELSLSEL